MVLHKPVMPDGIFHISMWYISCVHKENGHKNWEDDWTNVLPVMTNQITWIPVEPVDKSALSSISTSFMVFFKTKTNLLLAAASFSLKESWLVRSDSNQLEQIRWEILRILRKISVFATQQNIELICNDYHKFVHLEAKINDTIHFNSR